MAESGEIFIADYPYAAAAETELSLEVNDKIVVVSKEGEWIYGYKEVRGQRQEGWVAASYGHFRQSSPYANLDDRSKASQRAVAFQSLMEAEQDFIKILQELKEALIDVVSIRDDSFKRSFMNEPSVTVSFTILADMLKACGNFAGLLSGCRDEHSVAAAFLQFSPSMQLFAQYATENIKLLNAVKTSSKGLKKLLPKGFQLEAYLVAPSQHYPKYKTSIQEYVWLTPNSVSGKVREELESAMDKVIAQSDYVDLKLKEETEALRLLALQNTFTGHPAIFTPTRRILCELEIERVRVKANNELETKQFQAHLFNDCFIYSTYTVTGYLKLTQMADLRNARIDRSSIGGTSTGFVLYLNDDDITGEHFRVQDPAEFEEFMVQATTQMEASRANRTEVRTATIARRGTVGGNYLPGVQLSNLGTRAAEVYRFLVGEMQFAEAVATLNLVMVEPLLNAAKGAVLRANDGANSLTMENSTSKYQVGLVTEALKEADVLLCLRSVEGLTVSCKEFVGALEKACKTASWSENVLIGEVFRSVSAQTLYHQFKSYISGQQALLRVLRTAPFAQFYKDCEQILSSAPGTLEEKLDQPRQRIKLFGTFLSNLLRLTAASNADHAQLEQSIITIDNMDKEITELLRIKKNFEHLLEIQNSLVTIGNEPVIQKLASMERTFIRQGDLKKVCRKKNKLFRFWLVSDYLIYGSSLGGDKFSFNRAMELHKVSVAAHNGVTESGEQLRNAFAILGSEKSFIVIAPTPASCEEWIDVISKACFAAREAKGLTGSGSDSVAPVWQADALSDSCTQCSKKFTLWNRKHHCRKCGALVCSDHLKNREILPHISATIKQKVCDNCVKGITIAPAVPTSAPTIAAPTASPSVTAPASTTTAAPAASPAATPAMGGLSSLWKGKGGNTASSAASAPVSSAPTTATAPAPVTPTPKPVPSPTPTPASTTAPKPVPSPTPAPVTRSVPAPTPAATTGGTAVANPLKAAASANSDGMDSIKQGSVRAMIASKNTPSTTPATTTDAPKRVATSRSGAAIASKLAHRASIVRAAPPPPEEPAPPVPSTPPPPVPTSPVPSEAPASAPVAPPVPKAAVVPPPTRTVAPPSVPVTPPPAAATAAAVQPAAPAPAAPAARSPPPPPPRAGGAPPPPPPKPSAPSGGSTATTPPPPSPMLTQAPAAETLAEDDPFRRFLKMKDLMPPDAVRQKMKLAGFQEQDIERFLSGEVSRLPMPGEDSQGGGNAMDTASLLSNATLKPPPAAAPKPPAPAGGMMSLLGEIQRGQKLKAVQSDDTRMKPTTVAQTNDMLSMLAMKMTERRFKMGSAAQTGSDSDSDSSGFSDSDSDSDDD